MAIQILATLSKRQPVNVSVAQVFNVGGGSLPAGTNVGDELRWSGSAWSPFAGSKADQYDFAFAFGDLSVIPLVTVTAGKRVLGVVLRIVTPFSDAAAELSVGDASDHDLLLHRDHVAAGEAATYESAPGRLFSVQTQVNLYKSAGTSTSGAGIASILMEK